MFHLLLPKSEKTVFANQYVPKNVIADVQYWYQRLFIYNLLILLCSAFVENYLGHS